MRSLIQRFEPNRISTQKFTHSQGEVALFRLQGDIRRRVQQQFRNQFLRDGDCLTNGGSVSPNAMLSLLAGGGAAMATSSYFAGSLYIASASKASLMAIGTGYGSAVMGAGGIVTQAPFYAAGAAILPVIAPIVLMQAISTAVVLHELKALGKKMEDVKRSLSRLLERSEADHAGLLISADIRLTELEEDFTGINRFTPSMALRLTLLEDRINPLFERFQFLHQSKPINSSIQPEDLHLKQYDAAMTLEMSLLDLRLDVLRLRLATQEDIGLAERVRERLLEKIHRYKTLWSDIAKDPARTDVVAQELNAVVKEIGGFKYLPFTRARQQSIEAEKRSSELEISAGKQRLTLTEKIKAMQQTAAKIADGLRATEDSETNLIYWRDELGEHSYYTTDLQIAASPKRK